MHYRSWLLAGADSDRKLSKASEAGADVVVVDLVDVPDYANRDAVRQLAVEWLNAHRMQVVGDHRLGRWVRINALDSRMWREDLVVAMAGRPDGIVLPRSAGPAAVQQLASELYELEQRNQVPNGSTRIMPMAGDTPLSALTIAEYGHAPQPRLAALAWSTGELARTLGATRARDAKGALTGAFQLVRGQVLLAAHAAGIMALDSMDADQLSDKAARATAAEGRADGFSGMIAHDAAQIEAINEAFNQPDEATQAAPELAPAAEANSASLLDVDRRRSETSLLRPARRPIVLDDGAAAAAETGSILRPA